MTDNVDGNSEPDWAELTQRSLDELKQATEHYRPTNFWGPGLDQLLADMESLGLENFKSWPRAEMWFYPVYVRGICERQPINQPDGVAPESPAGATPQGLAWDWLGGLYNARRDYDAASLAWDQDRWPFDLAQGESRRGNPPEIYRLVRSDQRIGFGRAYLNYLLCMAALSRHVDKPPTSFLEIGGGYGALGELLLLRSRQTRYVDLDIPPLLTVASWYLTHRFPNREIHTYTADIPQTGPFRLGGTGVLPNYRLEDLQDEFEVFVNSYSFQEMEPDVVEHYIDQVVAKGITYAVSLNSREGKRKAEQAGQQFSAIEPVRSEDIVRWFTERGFEVVGSYREPLVRSAGELVVLKRTDAAPTPESAGESSSLLRRARRKLTG